MTATLMTVVLTLLGATAAGAQGTLAVGAAPTPHTPDARDFSITVGAGTSTDLGDWGGTHVTWAVGVRYGLSKHWAVEAEGGRWAEAKHFDYTTESNWDSSMTLVPTRRVIDDSQTQWHAAVSVVARTGAGAVSFSGGLGPALFVQQGYQHMEETRLSDQRRQAWQSSWTNVGVGLLGTGGIDVRLSRHVTLFAQARASLGMTVDTILLGVHAGARMAF